MTMFHVATSTGILLLTICLDLTVGFTQPSLVQRHSPSRHVDTRVYMFENIFGPIDDFFKKSQGLGGGIGDSLQSLDATDPDGAAGTFRLIHLPVDGLKQGGLRLFIMFYLLGMQNTPDKNSWKAHQPSTEEYVVDFWFHDQSAVLSVELSTDAITIDRVGSSPSTQYLMQEAVIVNGVLDELKQCATDQSVSPKDRLLILKDENAIDQARESLSFG